MKISDYCIYNIYALKKKKPSIWWFATLIVLIIVFLVGLSFLTFSPSMPLTGICHCQKNKCVVESRLDVTLIPFLKKNPNIKIASNLYYLHDMQTGDVDFLEGKNSIYQELSFQIQNYNCLNNEIIDMTIEGSKKNFWQIIGEALKGGEEK